MGPSRSSTGRNIDFLFGFALPNPLHAEPSLSPNQTLVAMTTFEALSTDLPAFDLTPRRTSAEGMPKLRAMAAGESFASYRSRPPSKYSVNQRLEPPCNSTD